MMANAQKMIQERKAQLKVTMPAPPPVSSQMPVCFCYFVHLKHKQNMFVRNNFYFMTATRGCKFSI